MTILRKVADLLPRPLDPIQSIKLKISILLLASGGAGLTYLWYEYRWQPPLHTQLITVAIVLVTAQLLGHGAVLGIAFTLDEVAELGGLDPERCATLAARALRAGLLIPRREAEIAARAADSLEGLARGRAARIEKPFSEITIVVREQGEAA